MIEDELEALVICKLQEIGGLITSRSFGAFWFGHLGSGDLGCKFFKIYFKKFEEF